MPADKMEKLDLTKAKWSIEIRDLQVLLAVAERGSFRRAAEHLRLGQSAVSRRIRSLEDKIGVSLFERRSIGSRLTDAGQRFSKRARSILHEVSFAKEDADSSGRAKRGRIAIGLIVSISKGPARNLIESWGGGLHDVELQFFETERSELLSDLSHRKIDALLAAGEPDAELGDALLIGREPIFLATCCDHPCTNRPALTWDDIQDETFIVSSREPGPEIHDFIVQRLARFGTKVDVRRHLLGREGIMNLVGLGFGVTLVVDHWRGVSYPNVTFSRIGSQEDTVPFSLTWRPENDNPALRRFISLARIESKQNGALS